jgi:hypothetical protein
MIEPSLFDITPNILLHRFGQIDAKDIRATGARKGLHIDILIAH